MPNRAITLHKPTVSASVGVVFTNNGRPLGATVVMHVTDGSLSAAAGLQIGMRILSINGALVTSPTQATGLIKAATGAVEIIVAAANESSSTAQVVPASSNLTDPHLVVFVRIPGECGCDSKIEKPVFDSWFRSQRVSETDFNEMMDKIVAPVNEYMSHQPAYITLTLVSCGLAGWCCQLAEACALKGKIQAALDEFNAKYSSVRGQMSQAPPGISFLGVEQVDAAAATPIVVAAVAAAPVVMQRDDQDNPEVKLEQLASMHGKGLITDDEFAAKRTEILARM